MTCATLADPKLHINTLTPVTLEKYVKPKVNLHWRDMHLQCKFGNHSWAVCTDNTHIAKYFLWWSRSGRPGYSASVRVRSTAINQSVCLCVCVCLSVCEHISGTAGPIGTKFCAQIPCGRGSVLRKRHCDYTLCTSGFVDDVTFGRNGRDARRWRLHSAMSINYVRDRGGVWCQWMLVFGLWSGFISRSVHARLQVSVCSGYDLYHTG